MDFGTCFDGLDDPRAANAHHRLGDVLVMMVAASLCGASNATEFALFAKLRKSVLNRIIDYQHPPSHDTFSRLLRLLDPLAFNTVFTTFAKAFAKVVSRAHGPVGDEVLAIDGKALRRAYERGQAAHPAMTVSAFACHTRLCLGVQAVGPRANEVEAALKAVELIDLTGKILTGDALHCHSRMAQAVRRRGGHYVLALKANRHQWLARADSLWHNTATGNNCAAISCASHEETSHGRHEWREAQVIAAPEPLMHNHVAFARITTIRDAGKPVTRTYMLSRMMSASELLGVVREHWRIENNLHWTLDVHFHEDQNRARKDNAPTNIALVKRLARNILQIADKPEVPISHRIKKCTWDDTYFINTITHMR